MNENRNDCVPNCNKTMLYKLQPGDGTRYTFAITFLGECSQDIFSGLGDVPEDYVMIATDMHPSGCVILAKSQLKACENDSYVDVMVGYAQGHGFGELYPYTAHAIVLAASVLVFRPFAVDDAAKAMLRVPALMA